MMNSICDVPIEIICEIISFLSYHDLIGFRMTCSLCNEIGLKYLNFKTNLTSAFWFYCQFNQLQWMDTRFLKGLNSDTLQFWFFHYSQHSLPFVVAKLKKDINCKVIDTHLQLDFSSKSKLLKIVYPPNYEHNSLSKEYDLTGPDIVFSERYCKFRLHTNLIKGPVVNILFNCFKPQKHQFYYLLKSVSNYYLYTFDEFDIGLLIESLQSGIRILKSTEITTKLFKIILLLDKKNILEIVVDIGGKKIEIKNCFKSSVKIDREVIFFDDCVFTNQKFRAFTLTPIQAPSWICLSLINTNE